MKKWMMFGFILMAISSCNRKELPVSQYDISKFRFIGQVGSDSVFLVAGQENVYLYTGYYKDTQNLMTLRSYFSKDTCAVCEPYLSLEVRDFDVNPGLGLAGSILDVFQGVGLFNSYSLDSTMSLEPAEIFQFVGNNSIATSTILWDFGDGNQSGAYAPTHVFNAAGPHKISLIKQGGGITDSISNWIDTDYQSNCRNQFTYTYNPSTQWLSVQASTPVTGAQYVWDFGNGVTGQGQSDSIRYLVPGKYRIKLTVVNASCTTSFVQQINTSVFDIPISSYTYSTKDTMIYKMVPRLNKSTFVVIWRKNGKEYRSYKNVPGINQSTKPVFTLSNLLPYVSNDKGQKTMMISGNLDAYLYNVSNANDSILIKSRELIFATAYPD